MHVHVRASVSVSLLFDKAFARTRFIHVCCIHCGPIILINLIYLSLFNVCNEQVPRKQAHFYDMRASECVFVCAFV